MEKIFNLTSTFKALNEDDDGGIHICGMASTADFDRAGDTISSEAWTKGGLSNFEKNPIILFNHDYNHPIGRATGLKVTDNGLELKAKISKNATVPSGNVSNLVKDGVLGAFSVGFRVKDADYLTETDGLKIKDAELFEVSVVSVPCNQAATFSLSKSFDSMDEYNEFKKQFTNSVDLAGQPLAKTEDSEIASDTPERDENVQKEIKMSEENTTPGIDLEAFAKKVAEETAAKIAMKQAESKAAEEKAAQEATAKAAAEAEAKAAQETEVKTAIKVGVESGADRLMADVQAKLAEKDASFEEVIAKYAGQLAEKEEELTKMRESKAVFADRSVNSADALQKHSKEFMHAHLAGVILGKGWNTDYAKSVFEKAGVSYTATGGQNDPGIDVVVSQAIEKEIQLELRTAALFREMQVDSQSTVLPLQSDVNTATWATGGSNADPSKAAGGTGLGNREATNDVQGNYAVNQKVIQVDRLISTSFLDNYIDEKVLINIMPMLTTGIARSHARAVDNSIINGNGGNISGLIAMATDGASWGSQVTANTTFSAEVLVKCRRNMGVYGLNPQDVVFIVSQDKYYDLLEDPDFQTVDEVGSDMAVRLTGQVGMVYGSPVVLTDNMGADVEDGFGGALAVNTSNFIIPRLRGVTVEQDYEVAAQRRILVGTQHLGFDELFAGSAGKSACTHAVFNGVA
jgi:HK97 family phage prohead protease